MRLSSYQLIVTASLERIWAEATSLMEKKVKNKDVVQAFLSGKPANVKSLVSTGDRLLSCGYWEVARWIDGKIVKRTGASYSQTTACHRGLVYGSKVQAASVETPVDQSTMNL